MSCKYIYLFYNTFLNYISFITTVLNFPSLYEIGILGRGGGGILAALNPPTESYKTLNDVCDW